MFTRYTPDEGVRGPGWVALTTRSNRAVTIGGTAVSYRRCRNRRPPGRSRPRWPRGAAFAAAA
eukprot:5359580-Pleurochrysis_carterae.AAC.1